jgi:hypothetical protein
LRGERLALQRYCQRSTAELSELGFALHPICDIWRPLSRCLHVPNPGWLGHGRDQAESGRYLRLELARAWRIENPTLWSGGLAGEEAALADPLFRMWRRLADRPAETWLAALREKVRVGGTVFDPNAPEGGGCGSGGGGGGSACAPYTVWASLSRKACVFGYSYSHNVTEAAGCPSAAPLGGNGAGHAFPPPA